MANIMENIHILGGSYEEWANILGLQWNSVENFIKGQIFTSIHNDNLSVEQKRSILELTNESVIVNIVNTTQEQEPVTEPVTEETTETVHTTSSKPKKKKAKKSKKTQKAPLNTLSNIEESVLKKYSAKELKDFLKTKKLLIKGNKATLVTRTFKAIMHPDQITEEDKPKKRGKKKKVVQEQVANNTSLSDDEVELLGETSIEAVEETNQNVTEEDENTGDTVIEDVEWNHSSTGMSSLFTDEEDEDDENDEDDE